MNKKSQTTLLKEAIYMVVAILGFLVLLIYGLPMINNLLGNTPDANSVKNFERLVKEIELTISEYQDWETDELSDKILSYNVEVPIDIDEKLGIKFYNPGDERPSKCRDSSKLCVCLAYVETFIDGKNPYKCLTVKKSDEFLFDKYEIDDIGTDSGLIIGSGISSYDFSFAAPKVISVDVNLNSLDSAYMNFNDLCRGYDFCSQGIYGEETSLVPRGSPFGPGVNLRITSGYRSKTYYNTFGWVHNGIDLIPSSVYYHTNIFYTNLNEVIFFAVCDGTAEGGTISSSGANYVRLVCDDGSFVRYLHNKNNFVKDPVRVSYGQPLGIMGNTGPSTGAHIHFEIHEQSGLVNPLKYILKSSFVDIPSSEDSITEEAKCQINSCGLDSFDSSFDESCINSCFPEVS